MNLFHSIFPKLILFFALIIFLPACDSLDSRISEKLKFKLFKIKNDTTGIQEHSPVDAEIILAVYGSEEEIVAGKWGNRENVEDMLALIENTREHGLNPEDYHFSRLQSLVTIIFEADTADAEHYADLDLLLTDAFLMISHHLAEGKTDPETIDPQWKATRRFKPEGLKEHIDSTLNQNSIREVLASLTPRHQYYQNLKKALTKYRDIETRGGWTVFNINVKKLELGMTHPDVATLRERLIISQGNPYDTLLNPEYFDSLLHEQVVIFQKRNAIPADGKVGKATVDALNIPVSARIETIEANLERWRWLNDNLGEKYVMVNIANYDMEVMSNGERLFHTEAIVGKPYRKTPVFSSEMKYMVLAPKWTIPPTILNQDVIPAVRRDMEYLQRMNMTVYDRNNNVIDPSTVNWSSTASFPYNIVQAPGKNNALGDVKFMFPNEYNVYIHDTPNRSLFSATDRSLSSGCIRIKKPLEFAAFLLQDQSGWSMDQIKKVVQKGQERTVMLNEPLPVHIIYLTAWADNEGIIHFRKDIYERDDELLEALRQPAPNRLNEPVENDSLSIIAL